jgi:hypothetical protein
LYRRVISSGAKPPPPPPEEEEAEARKEGSATPAATAGSLARTARHGLPSASRVGKPRCSGTRRT